MNKSPQALYIHIPFCNVICGYCSFTRFGYQEKLADHYLERLIEDLARVKEVETIYIGGGTPTALTLSQLDRLLSAISPLIKNAQEITIEANPDSLTDDKIDCLIQHGVNRVSLGVQTTDNQMLKCIGRIHSFEKVIDRVLALRTKDLPNITMDLMYGLPNQTLEDVINDLDKLLELKPVHLSLYALTIDENTAFFNRNIKAAPSELETQMYLEILKRLTTAGYQHYEIANFALEGYESLHNKHYWQYDDFYGVGVGASGKEQHVRYTNTVKLDQYLKKETQFHERIELTKADEMFETLMMGLRTQQGVSKDKFYNTFNCDLSIYQDKLAPFLKQGLLIEDKSSLYASEKGRLMLNDVLIALL